jgi:hypothetical protein
MSATSTDHMSKELKAVISSFRKTVTDFKRLKKVDSKFGNVVRSQDLYSKQLGKKNQEKLAQYEAIKFKADEKKTELGMDIVFRNFEMMNANIEMIKAYIDEYYERFKVIEQSMGLTLTRLEKYLLAESVEQK